MASPQIWKSKPDGTEPTQVTLNGGREPLCSADGNFVLYTKGFGGALIWPVPRGGGPESTLSLGSRVRHSKGFSSFKFPARRVATLGDWDKPRPPCVGGEACLARSLIVPAKRG